ncbi:hypothetical protein NLG97_g2562 [Lecanicillium saksenae]|uniref:Uncharacterized protein n=1 Tax=Lecanicillium saksenae TaxID=468837 RepID=A0ACC1R1T9_9HYPO|nr:hypothetical protein NLG97_g2562 [Lecanicillium saksenae]
MQLYLDASDSTPSGPRSNLSKSCPGLASSIVISTKLNDPYPSSTTLSSLMSCLPAIPSAPAATVDSSTVYFQASMDQASLTWGGPHKHTSRSSLISVEEDASTELSWLAPNLAVLSMPFAWSPVDNGLSPSAQLSTSGACLNCSIPSSILSSPRDASQDTSRDARQFDTLGDRRLTSTVLPVAVSSKEASRVQPVVVFDLASPLFACGYHQSLVAPRQFQRAATLASWPILSCLAASSNFPRP